jgi:hypothetical protein
MSKKAVKRYDAFSLSLGGMTTVAGFAFAPAIAHDRLRQNLATKAPDHPESRAWWWVSRVFRVA